MPGCSTSADCGRGMTRTHDDGAHAPSSAAVWPDGAGGATGRSQAVGTGWPAAKIDTWASSGSITPMTFCRVSRWTHEPQLSK